MATPKNKRRALSGHAVQTKVVSLLDDVIAFEEFQNSILPMLRADIKNAKLTAPDMYQKYQKLAAARGITFALREQDATKAMGAIKDILDRTQGKPKESKEIEHRLGKLPDQELDSLLVSEAAELNRLTKKPE
jgi:geranylgeranyl pyrophosphate synthase